MSNLLSQMPRVFDILAQNPRGLSVTEFAESMEVHKSKSSRLLASLVEAGLVDRDEAQRHYLNVRFWSWGVQAARRLAVLDIARPHIAAAVKEWQCPAYIAVVRGDRTIYLESTIPSTDEALFNLVSYAVPVYACAPGKAILAFSDEVTQEAVLRSSLKRFTPATHATREELTRELEKIRRDGFAINRGEFYDNGRLAVAAPVLDHNATPVAAVCFYGPTEEASLKRLIEPLLHLSQVLSSSLGFNPAYHELVG